MGNLLFCLRLGPDYRGDNTDPVAVLLVENCTVSRDTELAELSSAAAARASSWDQEAATMEERLAETRQQVPG